MIQRKRVLVTKLFFFKEVETKLLLLLLKLDSLDVVETKSKDEEGRRWRLLVIFNF
jgi:hypothetical protein